ncbi:MAG: MFS transporter, partial [Dehalococcoidales bacterium]
MNDAMSGPADQSQRNTTISDEKGGENRKPLFFYGWVMVVISIIGMMLVYGTRHSFSVFFPPILGEFGWSRGSTALMLSLNILLYGLTAPIAGSLYDRWKPHRLILFGAILLGLATAGCAFARELWHFYLLFGVLMPVGSAFSGWPLLGPTLSNWFAKKRGMVIGLAQMGGGLSFTYGIFVEFVISQVGWRYSYFVMAGIVIAVLVPLYLFFYRYRPEEKGLKPYGADDQRVAIELDASAAESQKSVPHDWTLRKALRTYQLWFLVVTQSLYWGVGAYLVLGHQVKFAEDVGYSSTFAASIFALFGIFAVAGQLSAALSDWIGREKTGTLAVILTLGALTALLSVRDTSQPWLLYLYGIGFGYGAGLCAPTIYAGLADIF